jgi:hypothetical protein
MHLALCLLPVPSPVSPPLLLPKPWRHSVAAVARESSSLPRRPLKRIPAGRAAAEVTRLVLATLYASGSSLAARSYVRAPDFLAILVAPRAPSSPWGCAFSELRVSPSENFRFLGKFLELGGTSKHFPSRGNVG